MRFLVFMIPAVCQPKNGKKTDPDFAPDAEMMAKMGKFNEELKKAGALLSLDGLQPLTTGTRLAFSGGKASVTDGPFVEAKEVVGGLDAGSQVEAAGRRLDEALPGAGRRRDRDSAGL